MTALNSHKAAQTKEERALFEAFFRLSPDFAGEKILETNPVDADPPDFVCVTASGRHIGVEICQLAHPRELGAGKLRERITSDLLQAIGYPQPVNSSKRFWLVAFCPKAKARIAPMEYSAFRQAFIRLIEHVENNWPAKLWGTSHRFRDLAQFSPLDRYIEQVLFAPGEAMISDADWIVPVGSPGWFDDDSAAQTMLELLRKKRQRCGSLKVECDDLYLVIAHWEAIQYGSPLTDQGLANAVAKARTFLDSHRGPFSGAFFFSAVEQSSGFYRLL